MYSVWQVRLYLLSAKSYLPGRVAAEAAEDPAAAEADAPAASVPVAWVGQAALAQAWVVPAELVRADLVAAEWVRVGLAAAEEVLAAGFSAAGSTAGACLEVAITEITTPILASRPTPAVTRLNYNFPLYPGYSGEVYLPQGSDGIAGTNGVNNNVEETGLQITEVLNGGTAKTADLRAGDVILGVGKNRTRTFEELQAALAASKDRCRHRLHQRRRR